MGRIAIISTALLAGTFLFAPRLVGAEDVAITFDDLPLNGALAPGMTRAGIVRDVLGILEKDRVPQVYGFVAHRPE